MESQPPSVAEPRAAAGAGLGALGLPTAPSASDFGRLVARWAEAGAALPVAVVVSVFDDLLAAAEGTSGLPTRARPLGLGDVMVDDAGVARLATPGPITVQELGELLRAALAGGSGDSAIPGAAHALLGRLRADAPSVEACDAEMVRVRLREALGPPAARHEVADCVRGAGRRARRPAAPPPLDFVGAVASGGGYGSPRDEEPVTALPTPPLAEDEDLALVTERPAPVAPDLEDDGFVTERPAPASSLGPSPGLPSVISARGVVESADARDPASGVPRPSSSPPAALDGESPIDGESPTDGELVALIAPEPVTEAQSASDVSSPEAGPSEAEAVAAPPPEEPGAPVEAEAAPVAAEALEAPPLDDDEDDEDDEDLPVPPLLDEPLHEPLDPPIARSDPDEEPERPPSLLPRVRLPPKRRTPLTLPSAPQARVRPPAGEESDGSILMPSGYSRRVWGVLISVGLVIGALLYAFGYLD